ncbi:hypothetical protein Hanom_Chr11g00991931 [Helianthus anomalus]
MGPGGLTQVGLVYWALKWGMWNIKESGLRSPRYWPKPGRRRPNLTPLRIQVLRKDVGKWWMRNSISIPLVNLR